MYKIAVIGERKKILFLKALGVEIFGVLAEEEARDIFKKIKEAGDFGVVFVQQDYFQKIKEEKQKSKDALPAVFSLPLSCQEREEEGELKEIIKRALGTEKITIK